jgi:hypothetical protein
VSSIKSSLLAYFSVFVRPSVRAYVRRPDLSGLYLAHLLKNNKIIHNDVFVCRTQDQSRLSQRETVSTA